MNTDNDLFMLEEDEYEQIESVNPLELNLETEPVQIEEIDTIELSFKDFPKIIKKKIIYESAIFVFVNLIILLALIFFKFMIEIIFVMSIVDYAMLSNIYYLYYSFNRMQCRIFEGYIVNIEGLGLPGSSTKRRRIVVSEENSDRILSFDYYGKAKISLGFPVILYLNKKSKVEMKDDIPYVKDILAVSFTSVDNEEKFEKNEDVNINEFLNTNE